MPVHFSWLARHTAIAAIALAAATGIIGAGNPTPAASPTCTRLGFESPRFVLCTLTLPNGGGSMIRVDDDAGIILQCSGIVDPSGKPNGGCAPIGTLATPGGGAVLDPANQQQVVLIVNTTAVIECTATVASDGTPAGQCARIGTLPAAWRGSAIAGDDGEIIYLTADGPLIECTAFIDNRGAPAGQCAQVGVLQPASSGAGWDVLVGGPVVFFIDFNTGALHGCIPLQSPTGVPGGLCV